MHSNHKDNSFIRSPLTNKSQYDQRFFTETKMPFKDSSNNHCRNMISSFTDYKIG